MEVKVSELISNEIITELAGRTINKTLSKSLDLKKSYRAKHSMIRANIFKIDIDEIPTFASTHYVRHKIGVEHFVGTNREDRGGILANRNTPINHTMILNAEALMTLANKRLCLKASKETRDVMVKIKDKVLKLVPELGECMVPMCVEKGFCPEYKTCGYVETEKAKKERENYLK